MTSERTALVDAVVVGGSAGAIDALGGLLGALPADFALPVVVVVHLPRQHPSLLAEAVAHRCRLPVHEVEDKEPLGGGVVYVAPPDYHLLVDVGPSFALSVEAAVNYSIPSIDVLFESAADVFGARVAGVVLTGANDDGARGLAAIAAAGGPVFVQDPDEASVPQMPAAAQAACPQATVATVRDIGHALMALSGQGA
ncbi:MAG TPA: chemotaxis protein CheB [Candidatus Binatia bacterium]|nr:chemotaxis protein CheB [Candidatus Binatia bacterium]